MLHTDSDSQFTAPEDIQASTAQPGLVWAALLSMSITSKPLSSQRPLFAPFWCNISRANTRRMLLPRAV